MIGTITLKEALNIIEQKDDRGYPIPFSISYRTLQRNSKKGGAYREVINATILTSIPKQNITNTELLKQVQSPVRNRKNPNHSENRTRNLQKSNKEIFKVHIRFIDSINNQKVIY